MRSAAASTLRNGRRSAAPAVRDCASIACLYFASKHGLTCLSRRCVAGVCTQQHLASSTRAVLVTANCLAVSAPRYRQDCLQGSRVAVSFTHSEVQNVFFAHQGRHIAPCDFSPKTVKMWNFAHKFDPERQIACAFLTKF